jgi:hypothetical protein
LRSTVSTNLEESFDCSIEIIDDILMFPVVGITLDVECREARAMLGD